MRPDETDFLYPNYKDNCISNIPGTILEFLNVGTPFPKLPIKINAEEASKVVLIVLDGFGYNQFIHYTNRNKFLKNLAERGNIYPLTSIFPSQTTNALTTLNTGLTPQQHGLFEYFLYLKEVDQIVNTLTFEPIGSKHRNELVEKGFDPSILLNKKTVHNTLSQAGLKSFTHIFASYAFSPGSKLLFNGSTIVPSLRSSDLVVNLKKNLEKQTGPAYFFAHFSNLDTIAHKYGPQSYEYSAELFVISNLLQKELIEKVDSKTAKETLLLVTADHGSVTCTPEETTYLNELPEIISNLKCGKRGKSILPTGSPRDVFLHVKEDVLLEAKELLMQKIGPKAKIVETEKAIKDNLFGFGDIASEFLERAGNLLILPYRTETVWFDHFLDRRSSLLGEHGGLNKEEMLVPMAITQLDNLR